MIAASFVDTSVGRLLLLGSRAPERYGALVLHGLYFANEKDAAGRLDDAHEDAALFTQFVADELLPFLAGERTTFDVRVEAHGTRFQEEVWSALRAIRYGTTTTYAAVARAIGRPDAVRAVGTANGKNPISIIVPCHRVIGSDGSLTGYAGGLRAKTALLALESCHA